MARADYGSGLFYGMPKNNFPTNNQIGYLIRIMQAAV
jgi:hypothetical protein